MYQGKLVFSQITDHLPLHTFSRLVHKYGGQHKVKQFSCLDQLLCLIFAQLTYRESLRDIEVTLRAHENKLYHMGIRSPVRRSTLADANESRDARIYQDFAQALIVIARPLYAHDDFGVELQQSVYALDASTIDLSLTLFPWASFRKTKAGIKLHTLLDLRGNIPSFIGISDARCHEVSSMDILPFEPGAFYIMDRGYLDFKRLYRLDQLGSFFVIRAKSNTQLTRLYSRPVDKASGLRCDQTISLQGLNTSTDYPDHLRRIKFYDEERKKSLVFLTNHFLLDPMCIAQLYKCRWQVELFFKWIKQHLRIKVFYGHSINAVKTQIYSAVCTYLLVAILKKRLDIDAPLYTILQILSLSLFENTPLKQLLALNPAQIIPDNSANQLILFD